MRRILWICLLWLAMPMPAFAQTEEAVLTPAEVMASALAHYPSIASAIEGQRYADGQLLEAQGSFDLTFEQELYGRADGYYDGRQSDSRLVKPMPYMNSNLYGGYRISDGNFPIYEDKRITNSGGEYLFGVQLSLLRNRLIDERRLGVANSMIAREIADIELELTRLGIQHDALYHYWQWLAAGHTAQIYADLLKLAQERQKNLQKQVQEGDVAAILLTENEQNLTRREAQKNEAERDFQIKSLALSLYLRDANGQPIVPAARALPEWPTGSLGADYENVMANIAKRPELALLAQNIERTENMERMGENSLLPKVDLNIEMSNDMGAGSYTRDEAEALVKLNISVPLQRRLGEGKTRQAQAKLRQLELEKQLTEDRLRVQMQQSLNNMQRHARFIDLTLEEKTLAMQMQDAERIKFREGGSDFFLLNLREEKSAEANIRHIEARKAYMISLTELYALTMDFSTFMPVDANS